MRHVDDFRVEGHVTEENPIRPKSGEREGLEIELTCGLMRAKWGLDVFCAVKCPLIRPHGYQYDLSTCMYATIYL